METFSYERGGKSSDNTSNRFILLCLQEKLAGLTEFMEFNNVFSFLYVGSSEKLIDGGMLKHFWTDLQCKPCNEKKDARHRCVESFLRIKCFKRNFTSICLKKSSRYFSVIYFSSFKNYFICSSYGCICWKIVLRRKTN